MNQLSKMLSRFSFFTKGRRGRRPSRKIPDREGRRPRRPFTWGIILIVPCLLCVIPLPALSATPAQEARDVRSGDRTYEQSPAPLDRERAIREALLITAENHPDANAVVVDELKSIRYQPDGTSVQWHEAYVKILSEEARRNYRTLSSYYTIPYQRGPEDCRIDLVEIIKPDGSSVPIDVAAQSRDMANPGSMQQNIYNPNDRLIQVSIAGLETNDLLHYRLFDRVVQPRMADTWCDWLSFEGSDPIRRAATEVFAPAARPLRRIAHKAPVADTLAYSAVTNADGILHRWEARDVPRMFEEPNMPAAHTVLQRVLISTVPDWQTISRWYWNLSAPHFNLTPEMENTVSELTDGLDSPQARIEALFTFVSQKIRYMGITVEATAPGYEPHDVKDTFEARHGVCRDKAALLVALLRHAGFDAFPTLIHSGPKKDDDVPQPYFNHAIVAVRLPGQDYQLMDPTDESTMQLLPAYLNDKSYLVATPEGDTLRVSPIIPAAENMMRIRTRAALAPSGRLSAETQLLFDGINDNIYRGFFAGRNPEERDRLIEGLVKRVIPEASVKRIAVEPDDMQDTSIPLSMRISYDADNRLVCGPDTALLAIPSFAQTIGMVNFILGQTGLEQRKYPLATEIACGVDEQIELDLPPDLLPPIALPRCDPVETDAFAWNLSAEQHENTLSIAAAFALKLPEYSPAQYLALKDLLRQIERELRQKIILPAPSTHLADPDARLLDVEVAYTLLDPSTWREERFVRREILTYAGKKKYGELKLNYNPAWETLELRDARVIAPDGAARPVSPQEINLMDADWVGAAPRYPAGKTLVAAFPAVQAGSVIEFRVSRVCSNRPFFSAYEIFLLEDPIRSKTIRLQNPEKLDTKIFTNLPGLVRLAETPSPDGTRAWSVADTPGIKPEDFTPPWHAFNPSVHLSSGHWPDYAALLHRLLLAAATNQPRAAAKARELAAGAASPEEQIRAIRDFIAINIRSAGPSLGEFPLDAISPADLTLAEGYGHCADTAILYYAMLAAAGFQPAFLLISDTPYLDPLIAPWQQAPDLELFSDVLVAVSPAPGTPPFYLNDGNQYSPLGASSHEDALALTLPEGRFTRLTPSEPAREERDYSLELLENGDVRLHRVNRYFGALHAEENERYTEMKPEDRRRHYQEMLAEQSQAATPLGELLTDFSAYPGCLEFSALLPAYAVRSDPYLYLTLPDGLQNLLRLRTDRRSNPYYNDKHIRRSMRLTLTSTAPATLEIMPENLDLDTLASAPFRLTQSVNPAPSRLEYRAEADLPPAIIPPSDYPALVATLQRLSGPPNNTLLLRLLQP